MDIIIEFFLFLFFCFVFFWLVEKTMDCVYNEIVGKCTLKSNNSLKQGQDVVRKNNHLSEVENSDWWERGMHVPTCVIQKPCEENQVQNEIKRKRTRITHKF